MMLTLEAAMRAACHAVGIKPPQSPPPPGRWKRLDTLGANGRGDASLIIFDDQTGGVAWNWQTQAKETFWIDGEKREATRPKQRIPDPELHRRRQEEQQEVERICAEIVRTCKNEVHPYLARKGFPEEVGLVHPDPRRCFPNTRFGEVLFKAMPQFETPLLIVPGRVGNRITTVQFITADGDKKNIYRGQMGGASHRIATGAETWVCEGIATALTVRAALRLLGRPATVLSAFSASNAAKVAEGIVGSVLAADHDKPIEQFDGLGTGEYYARRSGRVFTLPPVLGDFNDYSASRGLRAVALHLKGVRG
jgi:putative DNA primase/helicase